jgi:hypothetical protein
MENLNQLVERANAAVDEATTIAALDQVLSV